MKKKCVEILLIILLMACVIGYGQTSIASANENSFDMIIYPTGLYPQDLLNVQQGVDQGGTILLKAKNINGIPTAFNFGPAVSGGGGVFIRSNVTILGETIDSHMTIIRGGALPIRGFSPVKSAIHGIHFDGPYATAIIIAASIGTEIEGNKITNVTGYPVLPGIRKAVGIWASGFVPENISGELLIENNLVQDLDAEIGDGIALVILGADVHVNDNEIYGADTNGILINGNTHPVWIERNLVVPGSGFYPDTATSNGILAAHSFPVEPKAPVNIHRNTVICDNPNADGILLAFIEGSSITQNHVVMNNVLFGGISLFDGTSHTHIGENLLEGAGAYALGVKFYGFIGDSLSWSNTFVGNNISDFDSQNVNVFLDENSRDTVLVGSSGTVIDLGENNRITGYTKIGLSEPIGRQIRNAQMLKKAIWEIQQYQTNLQPDLPE